MRFYRSWWIPQLSFAIITSPQLIQINVDHICNSQINVWYQVNQNPWGLPNHGVVQLFGKFAYCHNSHGHLSRHSPFNDQCMLLRDWRQHRCELLSELNGGEWYRSHPLKTHQIQNPVIPKRSCRVVWPALSHFDHKDQKIQSINNFPLAFLYLQQSYLLSLTGQTIQDCIKTSTYWTS